MSNDREYTHYIVVNEVILGDASIVEKLNDWVSLAVVSASVAPNRSPTMRASRTTLSFPKSQTELPKPPHAQ